MKKSKTWKNRKDPKYDLGDLYKDTGDDFRKDRIVYDVDNDDEKDLSPTRGANGERLAALENCVENSA